MFILPKGSQINKKNVKAAIEYNEALRPFYNEAENYYLGKHQILDRDERTMASNNKVVVNHAKYITDVNIGYLLGNPVSYYAEEGVKIDLILEEYTKQNISDLDHEIAKDLSIFGLQYEYIYANERNEVKSYDIDVRNCVLVADDTVEHNKMWAVIYEPTGEKDTFNSVKIITRLGTFDFIDEKGHLLKEPPMEAKLHGFRNVPIIEYVNNSDMLGDFETVKTIIDAYNILQSDRVNDKEQLVDSLLALIGIDVTPEQLKQIKVDKVVANVPLDGDIKYVTKQLNEADTDVLRKSLEADIFKISMTPNLSDENFVGNSSGVAIKYKLLAFEQNTKSKERYFERGLKERLALYNEYLNRLNKMPLIEIHKVDAVFKRNLPQNDYETSQMINNLLDIVDRKNLLSQLSFIRDVDETIKAVEKEQSEMANTESAQFGTDKPTTNLSNKK